MTQAPRAPATPRPGPRRPADTRATARDVPAAGGRGSVGDGVTRGLWMAVCLLSLTVLTFVDRPGKIVADTKLDMAVSPVGFLLRALHPWDPAQFGLVQNQASGYFFPMGPFFALGRIAALPPWVVQRLWMTAVAVAAFAGVVRLAGKLGIGTPGTRLAAGFAYALSPAALAMLGLQSGEFLPAAMAPWIWLPLVTALRDPSGRTVVRIQAAARSAAAVALCGGVNGAAVVGAVLPAGVYLLLAPRPAARWRLLGWWSAAVLAAAWWWAYPLLVLQKLGDQFLTYTESAAVTTSVTSLSNVLRGTANWTTYLIVNGHPWWPVGFGISTGALATVLAGVVAGLGLCGLLWPGLPARRPLLAMLLAGVVIMASGYVSGLGNPLAGHVDSLINGPFAAFRNVRKFDPMVRLPIALGLSHLLASIRLPAPRRAVAVCAAAAMGLLAVPAYVTGLSVPGDFSAIPGYWTTAAQWLNRHAGTQAVVVVPGARFGEYTWGRPLDDVLEVLDHGDWASRQLNYIGSVGLARTLDAIDQTLAAGQPSPGLAQVLAEMGVRYLVVRNDLLRADLRGALPARIHDALDGSPGLVKVARFGAPAVGTTGTGNAVTSVDPPYRPVEIYQVSGAQPTAVIVPAAASLRVIGGPEAVLTLADQGLLRDRPVLLNSDSPRSRARWTVLTDTLRRRLRNFGELRRDSSATLTAADPAVTFAAANDFLEPGWRRFLAVARYSGIADVTASSSDSGITAIPSQSATGRLPFAALDGDLRTMWESGSLTGPVGQWIQVDLLRPVNPGAIFVTFAENPIIGPHVTAVTITTAAGQVTDRVGATSTPQRLTVPSGESAWLRITVTRTVRRAQPSIGRQAGIVEIGVPGVTASRSIVAPPATGPGRTDPAAIVLSKAEPQPSGCLRTPVRWVCAPSLLRPAEEQYGFDHSFALRHPHLLRLTGTAVLTSASAVGADAWSGPRRPVVTGSGALTTDPQAQPWSAFDGDPATAWISGTASRQPSLTIDWRRPRTISQVTISRPPAAAPPMPVLLVGSRKQVRGGFLTGPVERLRFRPMRTASLTIDFTPPSLPVQITDVTVPGVGHLRASAAPVRFGCGSGPRIWFDGTLLRTRVTAAPGALLTGGPVPFAACAPVVGTSGWNRVIEPASDTFDVQAVELAQPGPGGPASGEPLRAAAAGVVSWNQAERVLRVSAGQQSYLIVHQNFSPGWTASFRGRPLLPVRLDGWQQGWLLPAGTRGLVRLSFGPDAGYRRDLIGGLGLLAVVLLIAWLPWTSWWPRAASGHPAGRDTRVRPRRRMRAGRSAPFARARHGAGGLAAPRLTARPRPVARSAAAAAATALGFWLGGYPGALLVPVAAAVFLLAAGAPERHRAWRVLAAPWTAMALLTAAAMAGAVGTSIRNSGASGPGVVALWDTGPQILCLILVGRLVAQVSIRDRGPARAGDDPAVAVAGPRDRRDGPAVSRAGPPAAADRRGPGRTPQSRRRRLG